MENSEDFVTGSKKPCRMCRPGTLPRPELKLVVPPGNSPLFFFIAGYAAIFTLVAATAITVRWWMSR